MGCHTWAFIMHEDRQDELKERILEQSKKSKDDVIEELRSKGKLAQSWHKQDKEDASYYLKKLKDYGPDVMLNETFSGNKQRMDEYIEYWKMTIHSTYEEYAEACIALHQKDYDKIKNGELPTSFFLYDTGITSVKDGKIYLYESSGKYGDSLGRVYGYPSDVFTDADSLISFFKANNAEYDEKLIREVFNTYSDVYVEFG